MVERNLTNIEESFKTKEEVKYEKGFISCTDYKGITTHHTQLYFKVIYEVYAEDKWWSFPKVGDVKNTLKVQEINYTTFMKEKTNEN
jgi:hypothetical protein